MIEAALVFWFGLLVGATMAVAILKGGHVR